MIYLLKNILFLLLLFFTGLFLLGPYFLYVASLTLISKFVASLFAVLFLLPLIYFILQNSKIKNHAKKIIFYGLGAILVSFVVIFFSYSKENYSGERLQLSRTEQGLFSKLINVIPESDQLLMGIKVFTYLDRWIDHKKANALYNQVKTLYTEISNDEEFKNYPSVLYDCYSDMFVKDFDKEQYFLYIPKSNKKKLPVLIFVHGSLGNFLAYQWVLKPLADKLEMAVISPGFGAGHWNKEGGDKVLSSIFAKIKKSSYLDEGQLHMLMLSNGGHIVPRLQESEYAQVKSMVLMSAVIISEDYQLKKSDDTFLKIPKILIHGKADLRLPMAFMEEAVSSLQGMGHNLKTSYYDNEDHFLFFTQRKALVDQLSKWLQVDYLLK